MAKQTQTDTLKLPERLVSSVDLSRAIRELKFLDDWLHQAGIRSGGQPVAIPKTSATLEELATINGVSLLDTTHRTQLVNALAAFSTHAPRIHMSFAVEPSAQFLIRMTSWLRANVNPVMLLEIGLQPTLAAGCTVRTSNRLFDMSLRHRFTDQRQMLMESISKVTVEAPVVAAVSVTAPAVAATPAAPAPAKEVVPSE